jgi:hypothetical protein
MNEQNTSNQSEQSQKMKIKEALSTQELSGLLKGWLEALEGQKDFEFELKGHRGTIPKDVLLGSTTKGEYEFKDGEYEFELELKWKKETGKVQ